MLHDEAILITERVNAKMVTEANILQHAVLGVLSKGHRTELAKMVKNLNVKTVPFDPHQEPERLLPEGYEEE